jgi:hypothetical protein
VHLSPNLVTLQPDLLVHLEQQRAAETVEMLHITMQVHVQDSSPQPMVICRAAVVAADTPEKAVLLSKPREPVVQEW